MTATIATIVFAGVHHIFRLGPEFTIPTVILLAIVLVLGWRIARTGSAIALWLLAGVNALVFVWFGVIDGILDHVLKALGLGHLTLLPGGEAEIVDTYFQLSSREASSAFYEWTGIGEGLLSIVMVIATVILIARTRRGAASRANSPEVGETHNRSEAMSESAR